MSFTISVDTGGTFTDVIVRDASGKQTIGKALTTHGRVFGGLSESIKAAAADLGLGLDQLLADTTLFIYGTTRATNAIVTRNVAKTAFLTTEGFPDILVLKEGGKLDGYDFTKSYPAPYIPRRRTFEVPERIDAEGKVVRGLDQDAVRALLRQLAHRNFEAIGVCLLWSFINPEHELAVGALIEEMLPGVPYSLSHQLAPIIREYRRASATAIDASLKPLMQKHLFEFEQDIRAAGYKGQILVSTSFGGVMDLASVMQSPINMAKSGPSMAPVAGITYSVAEGLGDNMIVADTGGTTFDVGLSRNGQLVYSRDTWLGGMWEGDLLGISSVDIRSIGAGGGSIAWIDDGGMLRVGPQSAGSEPGPACYGRGGLKPTTSDAACVLGYFDPDYFLGGRMKLDVAAAREAIATIAEPLGLSIEAAAWGIMRIATDHMVKAIHEITVQQGIDPRESTVVAGGGAAGMNIMAIAVELGSDAVVLPKVASALSASGMQFADIVTESTAPHFTSTLRFDSEGVNAALAKIEAELDRFRSQIENAQGAPWRIEYFAEARYLAQVWELDTPIPCGRFTSQADIDVLTASFHDLHERVFAVRDENSPVEIINWKGRLTVELSKKMERSPNADSFRAQAPDHSRTCFFGGDAGVDTPIFKPADLRTGMVISGPAIVEEPTTTLVVYPGMTAEISGAGNYILHTRPEQA
ncbi:hydantoinase/oxoprolinase family protein [Sphingobium vermicomposti]|uniref:N-methylhydantoinase A n=1 Tax=Sphingobium vermicomposti TaxID=529005 RepID=A0A846MHU0_9SPHN|nr:hydantoinase/oxoprolinase family protein [Sphingobium vermicomposti]NIJ17846.1 N-methylhydantoinase A [Sphingobium vermicomposti]